MRFFGRPRYGRRSTAFRRVLRGARSSFNRWLGQAGYLRKWLALGILLGVVSGLGAIAFQETLTLAPWLFGWLFGWVFGDAPTGATGTHHAWAVPLLVGLGGLVSGLIVYRFEPEAAGAGMDAAIREIHADPRRIRGRTAVVKILASAVTIGSGGSGGREGPTAQVSAGFASVLCRFLDLAPEEGRTAVCVGLGAGIGSIFAAPLGGAVTAAEVLYRDDFDAGVVVPGLVASTVSFAVYGSVEGFTPLFGHVGAGYRFDRPAELVWFAVVGALCGLVAVLYATVFHGARALAGRLPGPRALRPAAGGLLAGLVAFAVPETFGVGYDWIRPALDRQQLLHLSLWLVLALPLAKIASTSLSIGSGGSGGVFAPGLLIGAYTGAAVWRVAEAVGPGVPYGPAPLVIVGMMACFGPIARTPLGVMLMVAEMTGSAAILAPAMVAVGVSSLITRRSGRVMFPSQIAERVTPGPAPARDAAVMGRAAASAERGAERG